MIRRPPRSTLFPTRRSSDLLARSAQDREGQDVGRGHEQRARGVGLLGEGRVVEDAAVGGRVLDEHPERSEEHTSELQSQSNLVCRLLLEKKKKENTHR